MPDAHSTTTNLDWIRSFLANSHRKRSWAFRYPAPPRPISIDANSKAKAPSDSDHDERDVDETHETCARVRLPPLNAVHRKVRVRNESLDGEARFIVS